MGRLLQMASGFLQLESTTYNVQSRAINFGHQCHSLTQCKMLHCKTVVNFIIYIYMYIRMKKNTIKIRNSQNNYGKLYVFNLL
jgi:hypothetical protein